MAQLHHSVAEAHRVRTLLLAGCVVVAACGDRADSRAAAVDSTLSRDLTLAASATPTVAIGDTAESGRPDPLPAPAARPAAVPSPAPAVSPTPRAPAPPVRRTATRSAAATAPVAPAPAADAPAPAPVPAPVPAESPAPTRGRAIGAGTTLTGMTNAPICALAQRPGDRFVVSLGREVAGPDGGALPAGTPVLVELARADTATGEFSFRLKGIQLQGDFIPAEGTVRVTDAAVTERKVSKGGSDQGRVVTGAIIGGILGRVMGGGARGAVIGAAGGAAAGTIAAARNTMTERCMAAGATLTATLSAPLPLPLPLPL